jgi:hypothetical protein
VADGRNLFLNTGLVVAAVVAAILVYALYARVTVERPDPRRLDEAGRKTGDYIQVEVFNGCGQEGVAKRFRDHFVELGFDVVGVDNYSRMDVAETMIVDRAGNLEAARQVALALGVPESRIVQEIRPDYFLDVMVVIGLDYAELTPYSSGTGSSQR